MLLNHEYSNLHNSVEKVKKVLKKQLSEENKTIKN